MNTAEQTKPNPAATVQRLGLSIKSEFVPFSQSRNAKEKHKTLNWRVTLQKDGRGIITFDYSAGVAHCPAYKISIRQAGGRDSIMRHEMLTAECETGFAVRIGEGTGMQFKGARIEPDSVGVIYSLIMDADAIDYQFTDWCDNYGYDSDSRKAEAIYKTCLEHAIAIRSALGEAGLSELREAFQDY